jgi:hypothetical protein
MNPSGGIDASDAWKLIPLCGIGIEPMARISKPTSLTGNALTLRVGSEPSAGISFQAFL